MTIWTTLRDSIAGANPLFKWLILFVVSGFIFSILRSSRSFLRSRKIQPNGFRWRTFRNEIFFAVINLSITVFILGGLTSFLTRKGVIVFNNSPTSGWVVALEYAAYFIGFDTYFYWLHRLMHIDPIYTWVHKLHHRSTSPNLLTTLSVSPLESLINGGFVPLFTALLTVHSSTMALIGPTNVIMGLYVHSGYEFLPRWWNKSWVTKWFITTTFHDQHHKYFNWNYGGYTTVWDWICGTVRPKYLSDFDKIKARASAPLSPVVAMVSNIPER